MNLTEPQVACDKILVVDDDPDELFATSRILQKAGYTVEEACCGEEAVDKASTFMPDLMLLDVVMPGMDGFEVCQRIKSDQRLGAIFIVLLSSIKKTPDYQVQGLDSGADGFISRPFHTVEFLSRIRSIMRIKSVEKELRTQRQWLRITLSSIGDGLIATDAEGRVLFMNPVAEDITGWKIEEARLRDIVEIFNIVDDMSGQPIKGPIGTVLKEGAIIQLDDSVLLIKKNQNKIPIADSASPIRNEDGSITGGVLVFRDITDKKIAEQTAVQALREWGAMFRAIGQMTLIIDPQHGVLDANEVALQKTGLTRDQIVGRKCFELIYGDSEPPDNCPVMHVLRSARQESAVMTLTKLHGDFLVTCTPVVDDNGKITKVIFIATDIGALRATEKELRDSQEQLSLALEVANLGMWEFNPTTSGEVYFSDKWFAMLGYEANEFPRTADTLTKLLHPDDREKTYEKLKEHIEGRSDYVAEFRLRAKDGSYHWINSIGKIVRWDDQGNPERMIGIHLDITERKTNEMEMIRLQTAMGQSNDGVVITDDKGLIQYVNPAFENISGFSKHELIGHTPAIVKSGHHDQAFYRDLWGTIAAGGTWAGRMVNRRKDGSLFTEEATISPVRDISGRIVNYVSVKRDITEKIQLEDQFRQAQKMEAVGRLSGGVAHDFNNMLGVILGFTDLAIAKLAADDPIKMYLEEVRTAGERSADITRQLLAFARKQTIAPRVLDLNDTIASMLKMLRRLIGEDIELLWKPARDLWPVKMDPSQIDQILANLVVNARDAIAGVGKIVIETGQAEFDADDCERRLGAAPGRYVRLTVSDDGCGMDKETLAKIFEPFFTTKEAGKGTGLGLATVYGIVKQNNGFVDVQSTPGRGTTFKIYLPSQAPQAVEAGEPHAPAEVATGTETVLLVEDEASLLKFAGMLLEELGYTVLAAGGPREALGLAKEYPREIHLLMTDVVMPKMSGRDLCEQIAASRPGLKCLYMSGYTADVIAQQGVLEEGVHFLQKPFSREALARKIREALS